MRLNGKSEVYSLLKQEGTPISIKDFTAEVLLVAVPRTEKTARGLLADSFINSYDLSKKGSKMIRNKLFVILYLLIFLNTAEAREPVTKRGNLRSC